MKRYIKSDTDTDKIYKLWKKGVLSQSWGSADFVGRFSTFEEALAEAKRFEKDRMWKIMNVKTHESKTGGHCKFKNMRFDLND